jgi:hypothetical protein
VEVELHWNGLHAADVACDAAVDNGRAQGGGRVTCKQEWSGVEWVRRVCNSIQYEQILSQRNMCCNCRQLLAMEAPRVVAVSLASEDGVEWGG